MPFPSKLFLQSVLWVFSFSPVAGMQAGNPDVAWYEEFFQEKKRKPVEESFKQVTAKLDQAIRKNNPEGQAKALKELGLLHLTRTNDYDMAMDMLIQCLVIEDSLNLEGQRIFTYLAMAKVFEEVGNYNTSEQLVEQALRFNEPLQNPELHVLILNELGQINASTGKMEEALKNYEQVLEYKDVIENPKAEAQALFNIAHLYSARGDYNRSLQNHKRALAIRRSIKDKRSEALSLNDIGELYRLMKMDPKAMANHQVALEIRQALKDEKGIAESYNNIGILYYQQKKLADAISSLQSGLQAALESQTIEQQQRSYDYLSLCYKELGQHEEALKNRERFVAVNDFIQNQKYEQQLLESQSRYVIDSKESQIESLESERSQSEQELRTQKKLRNFLISLIGLGLVIVGLIFSDRLI